MLVNQLYKMPPSKKNSSKYLAISSFSKSRTSISRRNVDTSSHYSVVSNTEPIGHNVNIFPMSLVVLNYYMRYVTFASKQCTFLSN